MENFNINLLNRPVVTGTPAVGPQTVAGTATAKQPEQPFLAVLQQHLQQSSETAFSKHALSRVAERNVDVSQQQLERLDEGVKLAQEKGLREALILIDQSAYIVNAAAGRVVTVDNEALKGSVFTNIDGTVIV